VRIEKDSCEFVGDLIKILCGFPFNSRYIAWRKTMIHMLRLSTQLLMAAITAGFLICLPGCSAAPTPSQTQSASLTNGSAQVLSIDPWMWSAQVVYEGQQRTIWWDQQSVLFYNGEITTPTLAAKPGDTINFDGVLSDGDIYLGCEWIGPAPPTFEGTSSQTIAPTTPTYSSPSTPQEPVSGGITPLPIPSPQSPVPGSTGITPLPLPSGSH
jgi:hypothetical protein